MYESKSENYICLRCLNHFAQYVFQWRVNLKENKRNLEIPSTSYLCRLPGIRLLDYRAVGL